MNDQCIQGTTCAKIGTESNSLPRNDVIQSVFNVPRLTAKYIQRGIRNM